MRILSFDVGIKNLAYSDVDFPDLGDSPEGLEIRPTRVIRTGVVDVSAKTVSKTILNIVAALKERFRPVDYEVVLIENQPSFKNPKVKTVQTVIHTWFSAHAPPANVVLCAPKGKNILCCALNGEEPPKNYREAKQQAVRTAKALLGASALPKTKPDDVADSFLQALHFFLKSRGGVSKEAFDKCIIIEHETHHAPPGK